MERRDVLKRISQTAIRCAQDTILSDFFLVSIKRSQHSRPAVCIRVWCHGKHARKTMDIAKVVSSFWLCPFPLVAVIWSADQPVWLPCLHAVCAAQTGYQSICTGLLRKTSAGKTPAGTRFMATLSWNRQYYVLYLSSIHQKMKCFFLYVNGRLKGSSNYIWT